MASSWAARQALTLARLSASRSAFQSPSLIQRRCLSGAADHHGPAKVNCWSEPMSPSKWKEEHFVLVSLSGWGLLIFGGYKAFSGGKKEEAWVLGVNNIEFVRIVASNNSVMTRNLYTWDRSSYVLGIACRLGILIQPLLLRGY